MKDKETKTEDRSSVKGRVVYISSIYDLIKCLLFIAVATHFNNLVVFQVTVFMNNYIYILYIINGNII